MKKILYIAAILFCASISYAEDVSVVVDLYNGSRVIGFLNENLVIKTIHNSLNIPAQDISFLKVGYHCESQLQTKIEGEIKALGSSVHVNRMKASSFLVENYRYALPLLRVLKTEDREQQVRIKEVMDAVVDKDQSYIPQIFDDCVECTNGAVYYGRIDLEKLKINSRELGNLNICLYDIKNINFRRKLNDFKVYAEEMWKGRDWVDTGLYIDGSFKIEASGTVDLYPETPEKWLSGPDGSNFDTKDGRRSGTLLGKIGRDGPFFIIGKNYLGSSNERGRLFVRIQPSSWNVVPNGFYTLKVK